MIVYERPGEECPTCGGSLGVGLKEEPTGWKVYAVCTSGHPRCLDERVGTVPRAGNEHVDEVIERANRYVADAL